MRPVKSNKISPAFRRDVLAARASQRKAARGVMVWGAFAVKKNGDLYAKAHREFATEAEAAAECDRMMGLNPGSTYRAAKL